ncbi:MAG TPA: hypothetical protein VF021_11465 [Longimicrobiales bacterium]
MKAIILAAIVFAAGTANAQVPSGSYTAITSGNEGNVAIEQATADLNFIKRPIARRRLRKANPVMRTLAIRVVGDSVEVTLNDQWILRTKLGSIREWRGYNSEPLQVSTELKDGVLTNTFVARDGKKQNRYVLRGDELELQVRITSPRLRHAVEYVQRFRKSSSAEQT